MLFEIAIVVGLILVVAKLLGIGKDLLALRMLVERLGGQADALPRHVDALRGCAELIEQHAGALAHEASTWSSWWVASEKSLYPPLLALLRGESGGIEKGWRIENQGLGPAVDVRWVCSGGGSSGAADPLCLVSSLPVGGVLALGRELVITIDESIEKAAAVAAKAHDLEDEGYNYRDLYGEDDLEFTIILEYESIQGQKYSTRATWPRGETRLAFEKA